MKKIILLIVILNANFLFSSDWKLKDSIGGKELMSFCCRDTNNCYAVVQYADSTRILKSTDQGATWFRIFGSVPHYNDPTPIPEIINSKWGISPGKNFFYMTDLQAPVIRKSTDDCKTFIDIAVDSIEYSGRRMPQGFDMLDTNIGFLITGINLFVTKNGWNSFEKLPEPIAGQYLHPRFMNDSVVAMLCGLKTGMKFVKYNINQKNMEILFEFPKDTILDRWYNVMKYHFVNDSVGFGCGYILINSGGGAYNIIFKTTNGGKNWKLVYKEINSPSFGLTGIAFYDENNGVAVATYGNIITTNDGGETWLLNERPAYTGEPGNLWTSWVSRYPLVGTIGKGGIFRYEGDFFDFDTDTDTVKIQAENQDFGKKEIHDTTTTINKIKIHNLSDYTDLNISGFSQPTESAFVNQFVWLDTLTYITVKPNEYFELPVRFKPTEMRKYKDSIIVFSNASMLDSVIVLEGEGIDSSIGVEEYDNTMFKVSYNNSIIRIVIDKSDNSNIDISLFNLTGGLLLNKTGSLQKGRNSYEIDISNLITGIYIYNINIDGSSKRTGKINIIR